MMQQVHGLITTGTTYGTQSRCSSYFQIFTPQYFAYYKRFQGKYNTFYIRKGNLSAYDHILFSGQSW